MSELEFSNGYWLESSKKFYFKNAKDNDCGLQSMTLNLERKYITSLQGSYLDLRKGDSARWKCGI